MGFKAFTCPTACNSATFQTKRHGSIQPVRRNLPFETRTYAALSPSLPACLSVPPQCPLRGCCQGEAIKKATARSHLSSLIAPLQNLTHTTQLRTKGAQQHTPLSSLTGHSASQSWMQADRQTGRQSEKSFTLAQRSTNSHKCSHSLTPLFFVLLGILREVTMLWHDFIVQIGAPARVCLCKTISGLWRE